MAITVLLIDKHIPFIVSLKQALEGTGDFRVTLAANPGAADEALRFGSTHIAVVDFDLPDMDVMELIRLLRSIQPDLPILLTPENDLQTERAQFMDVQGVLVKPYTARDLIPRVQKIVERAGTAELPLPEELDFLSIDNSVPFDLGGPPEGDAFNLDQLEVPPGDMSDPESILEEFETMERAQTGLLFSEDDEPVNWQTRVFDDDWSPNQPGDDDADIPDAGTRIFDDVLDADYPARTHKLDNSSPEPSDTTTLLDSTEQAETRTLKDTEEFRQQQLSERQRRSSNATRPLPHLYGDDADEEFEHVNPFVGMDDDTGMTDEVDEFDDVLDAVKPSPDRERSTEDQAFQDLVDSMSRTERPKSHATRLEALLSSIATDFAGGEPPQDEGDTLDYVLDAIRQGRSPVGPSQRDTDAEGDDTTIGDVIDGLFDPAFEGVLAALAGEQIDESKIEEPTYENMPDPDTEASRQDVYLAAEGDSTAGGEPREFVFGEAGEPGEPAARAPGESAIPGPVIVEPPVTSEDSSKYPATTALSAVSDIDSGSFSLDDLLSQIEEQLPPVHTRKPRLKPLPSWKRDGLLDKESNLASMFDRAERTEQDTQPRTKLPSSFAEPGERRTSGADVLPPVITEPPITMEDTHPSSSLDGYSGTTINEYGIEEYEPQVEDLDQEEMYADIAPPPDYDDDFAPQAQQAHTSSDFDDMDLLSLDELMARADLPPEAEEDEIDRDRFATDSREDHDAIDLDDVIIEPTDAEVEAAFYDGLYTGSEDDYNAPVDLTADLLGDLLDDDEVEDYDAEQYDAEQYDTEDYDAEQYDAEDYDARSIDEEAIDAALDDLPVDLTDGLRDGQPDDLPEFLPEPLALDDTELAWFEEAGEFVIPDDEHLIEMPVDEATQRIEAAIVQEDEQEEDVAIAQLAVQLTQYSLESSAQATLLSHNGDLIAYAGEAEEAIVEGIFKKIHNAWVNTAIESDSLIRFISLPDNGEYLVYSTRLTNETILSMAFHASTSLSTIRRQAHRLSESLDLIPDSSMDEAVDTESPAQQTKPAVPTEIKPLRQQAAEQQQQQKAAPPPSRPAPEELTATYTALWMPNDPGLEIGDTLADAIERWVEDAADSQVWSVNDVIAQSDYVSLRLRAPQKLSPDGIIHDLMQSTSDYINDTFPQIGTGGPLWTDGYYLVTPARALTDREIMRIMTVQRNAQLNG